MSSPRMRVAAGGDPGPAALAALAAAGLAVVEAERAAPAPDPVPAAYRSRWRRAAMIEMTDVPPRVKDDGPPWGGLD